MTPVVAVLDELSKQTDLVDVQFVCDKAFIVQAKGIISHAPMPIATHIISAGKLRRYKHFRFWHYLIHPSVMAQNLLDIGKIFIGVLQSIKLLRSYKPDVIFLKGGYVCLPIGFAARVCRIPMVIHDSDVRPGLTNRILAPRADKIATGYPVDYYPYDQAKTTYTGVPINANFTTISSEKQQKIKQHLRLSARTPMVVAIGGGLGAQSINNAIIEALPKLAGVGAHAYIVAGKGNYDAVKAASEHYHNVTVLDFLSEGLVTLLAAADVVVARASATSLQELAGLGKPAIIVPSKALGDQHMNAAVYQKADAAVVMSDTEIEKPGSLGKEIVGLLHSQQRRDELARNIHEFARPHAARDVATIIRELSEGVR